MPNILKLDQFQQITESPQSRVRHFVVNTLLFVLMVVEFELAQQLFDSEEKRRGKSTPALGIVAAHIEDIWSRC